jgi:hypothetical protein
LSGREVNGELKMSIYNKEVELPFPVFEVCNDVECWAVFMPHLFKSFDYSLILKGDREGVVRDMLRVLDNFRLPGFKEISESDKAKLKEMIELVWFTDCSIYLTFWY